MSRFFFLIKPIKDIYFESSRPSSFFTFCLFLILGNSRLIGWNNEITFFLVLNLIWSPTLSENETKLLQILINNLLNKASNGMFSWLSQLSISPITLIFLFRNNPIKKYGR